MTMHIRNRPQNQLFSLTLLALRSYSDRGNQSYEFHLQFSKVFLWSASERETKSNEYDSYCLSKRELS